MHRTRVNVRCSVGLPFRSIAGKGYLCYFNVSSHINVGLEIFIGMLMNFIDSKATNHAPDPRPTFKAASLRAWLVVPGWHLSSLACSLIVSAARKPSCTYTTPGMLNYLYDTDETQDRCPHLDSRLHYCLRLSKHPNAHRRSNH